MLIASHSCEAHSMIARIHTTPRCGTAWRNIFDKKSARSSPVRAYHAIKDMPYQYKREPLTPDEANRLASATEIATRYPVKKPTDNITSVTRTCIQLSLRFCRKVRFLGQNPKIGCQEFNDLETPKLSKKQLCDRTRKVPCVILPIL